MVDPHIDDALHEQLRQALTAETEDEARAARLAVAASPAGRARLDELARAMRALDVAGKVRNEDLAAGPVPGEDAFVAACRAQLEHAEPRRAPRFSPWLPALAAAALLLVFAGLRWYGSGDTAPRSTTTPASLGAHDLECSAPNGEVAAYGDFRWTGSLAAGESYDLWITDLTRRDARPEVVAEDLVEPAWTPSSAELAALPRALRWTVRVRGADGRLTEASASAEASRR